MLGHVLQRAVARAPFKLLAAIACAYCAAAAASSMIAARVLAPATAGPKFARVAAPPTVAQPERKGDGRDLVARDMFCSSCTPPAAIADGVDDTFSPQAVLIATIIGDTPRCTVRSLATAAQGDYGVGDSLAGVGAITRIGWRSIDLVDRDGRHGKLDLLDSTSAAARGEDGAATPTPGAAAQPWDGRITKIDDHTFEVDRGLVRDLVSGAAKPGGARVGPRTENGKLTGLRMFGIKEPSLAGALGMQNGDVMTGVNNVPITSMQTLLDVYAHVDSLNVVEIAAERAGKPMTLTLRLR
ncbi:MAG TPA: type II secretion system protein GspC [Kofleriaceae bacterium]|jgi:hypothetical protein|nr:type II secretion system protein GspC [Kofleriaceae bacterium]